MRRRAWLNISPFFITLNMSSLISLILAVPFPDWVSETALTLGPLSIKWYGLGYILGLLFAYFYVQKTCMTATLWEKNSASTIPNKAQIEDYVFICFLGIFIGGRLGYVVFYGLPEYLYEPLRIIKVWEGGMSFHGGFIGVCCAAIYTAHKQKIPLWRLADLTAISAPIGLFLVRLANFANQELYGRTTEKAWGVIFETDPYQLPRHPSQLYEAFLEGFMIFIILLILTRKARALHYQGLCTGLFFILYGVFRSFVETMREPDASLFFNITRGQAYSLPMVIIGLGIVYYSWRRLQKPTPANNG